MSKPRFTKNFAFCQFDYLVEAIGRLYFLLKSKKFFLYSNLSTERKKMCYNETDVYTVEYPHPPWGKG